MIHSLKYDYIGASASFLCLIHCLATPFVFLAKACSVTCCSAAPGWWHIVDYIFVLISLFSIYQISRTKKKNWVMYALWLIWITLLIILINETLTFVLLPKEIIFVPAILLIVFHLYHLKYCTCKIVETSEEQFIIVSQAVAKKVKFAREANY
jgi:hypothetical protein